VGDNPLGASLAVRAKDTAQYESIAKYLEGIQITGTGSGTVIEKVNFTQNKTAIDRLTALIAASRTMGLMTAIIFALASIIISFNTIRLVIYTARDEIGVMNLVGAGTWYVRGPFVIAGILYGVIAGAIVLIALYPLTAWMAPGSERLFAGAFDTSSYYFSTFPRLFLEIMGTGIVLGAISSYLAVRRYLRS
jgi:cell division transport system permease protein